MNLEEEKEIVALIPTYNEVGRINSTLETLKRLKILSDIVVVNDGSTDGTEKKVKEAGIRMISFPKNLGKGNSLNKVIPTLKYDILVMLDADLGYSAVEIEKLINPIIKGEADMTIAAFPPAERKGGFGLVKWLARWGINKLCGKKMVTPLSGQRAIKKEAFNKIKTLENGFGLEVALTIDAFKNGLKVVEVPTTMTHAETGRNLRDFFHRGKQFKDVLIALLKRW